MNITFRQLRVFVEVAQQGSVTAAAQSLHLTPPAVSMQIRQLETDLDTTLFERPQRQRLTDAAGGTGDENQRLA